MNADTKTICSLAGIMAEKELTRIEIHDKDLQIVMEKQQAEMPTVPALAPTPVQQQPVEPAVEEKPALPKGKPLTAPLVGVGYTAPQPGAAPFVAVGDSVKKGQVLCIIEAMKVMNELPAPEDGTIAEICFEDGQLVEYGQCLFRLQ